MHSFFASSLASPGLRSPWSTSSYAFPHVISRKQSQAQPQPQDGDAKVVVAEKVGAASSASPRPRESTLADPSPPGAEKDYAPKVRKIVDDIAALTLMEVADLNELLKVTHFKVMISFLIIVFLQKTLKIPDQTFMSTGNFAPAQAAAVSVSAQLTNFAVKIPSKAYEPISPTRSVPAYARKLLP